MSEPFLGLGAIILSIIDRPIFIDDCFNILEKDYILSGKIRKKHTFDNYILTLYLLVLLNAIEINERGEIIKCTSKN